MESLEEKVQKECFHDLSVIRDRLENIDNGEKYFSRIYDYLGEVMEILRDHLPIEES